MSRPQITKKRVLEQLSLGRWRVWSKIAQDITGEPPTMKDVRKVRDLTRQLQGEGLAIEDPRGRGTFRGLR